jgi:TonB family protein
MAKMLLGLLLAVSCNALAQDTRQPVAGEVVITKLSSPIYPQLALQARIAGAVELNVTVQIDGSIEAVAVVSGHPLLRDAALTSARHTQWECKECATAIAHRFEYRFEPGEPLPCSGWGTAANGDLTYAKPAVMVTQSGDTITIIDSPVPICDPAAERRRVRSPECLYLWRCRVR